MPREGTPTANCCHYRRAELTRHGPAARSGHAPRLPGVGPYGGMSGHAMPCCRRQIRTAASLGSVHATRQIRTAASLGSVHAARQKRMAGHDR
jgi:hypothetical protein